MHQMNKDTTASAQTCRLAPHISLSYMPLVASNHVMLTCKRHWVNHRRNQRLPLLMAHVRQDPDASFICLLRSYIGTETTPKLTSWE
jgi:hypothetical protein